MRKQVMMVLAVCLLATAGCGGKERTTTTTTVRTSAVAAPSAAPSASARMAQPQAAPAEAAAVSDAGGITLTPGPGHRGRGVTGENMGKTLLGAAVAGSIIAAANGGVVGIAGATGPQCENPYGGQTASRTQGICSETQERLDCSCTETSCQLIPTGIAACGPAGQVVN